MTLEQVEQAIHDYYFWFFKTAPGVVVREEGRLAQLWSLADRMISEEAA